jgi:hypothetical protein
MVIDGIQVAFGTSQRDTAMQGLELLDLLSNDETEPP